MRQYGLWDIYFTFSKQYRTVQKVQSDRMDRMRIPLLATRASNTSIRDKSMQAAESPLTLPQRRRGNGRGRRGRNRHRGNEPFLVQYGNSMGDPWAPKVTVPHSTGARAYWQ